MKYKEFVNPIVDEFEYKKGISYVKTDSRVYISTRVVYILSFVYKIFCSLILIAGMSFVKEPLEKSMRVNVISSAVLYMLAFVVMLFKVDFVSAIFNILAVILEMTVAIPGLVIYADAVSIQPSFYWKHLIPMLLVLITCGIMAYISVSAYFKRRRSRKTVLDKLYNENSEALKEGGESAWEELLKSTALKCRNK